MKRRVYSRSPYMLAVPRKEKCVYCGKSTSRHDQGAIAICSECAKKHGNIWD